MFGPVALDEKSTVMKKWIKEAQKKFFVTEIKKEEEEEEEEEPQPNLVQQFGIIRCCQGRIDNAMIERDTVLNFRYCYQRFLLLPNWLFF